MECINNNIVDAKTTARKYNPHTQRQPSATSFCATVVFVSTIIYSTHYTLVKTKKYIYHTYIKEQMYRRYFVFLCRPVHGVIIKKHYKVGRPLLFEITHQ